MRGMWFIVVYMSVCVCVCVHLTENRMVCGVEPNGCYVYMRLGYSRNLPAIAVCDPQVVLLLIISYFDKLSGHVLLKRVSCSVLCLYYCSRLPDGWLGREAVAPSVGDGVAVRSFARTVRGTMFKDAERFLGVRSELAGSHGPHLAVSPQTFSRLGPPHLPTAPIRLSPYS